MQQVIDLYASGLGTREVASKTGKARHTVQRILRDAGVVMRDNASRTRHLDLTPGLLEILDGELLGDGCLAKSSEQSARFRYNTSKPDYLRWLFGELVRYGLDATNVRESKDGRSGHVGYEGKSASYAELLTLYRRWYPNDKKRIPADLVLTPTVLRHWYVGDGYLKGYRHKKADGIRSEYRTNHVCLATNDFPLVDLEILMAEMRRIGLDVGLNLQHGKAKGRGQYNLAITGGAEGYQRFFDYIGQCPTSISAYYGHKWQPRKVLHDKSDMTA